MKNLRYFLFGSAVALVFISIIEKFMELIMLWIEILKIKPTERIMKHKKDVTILSEFLKPTRPVYDDMYEDEFEDEDE